MNDVCTKQLQRANGVCTHNLGLLGVCLCDKHYNHRNEEWSDEEIAIYKHNLRRLMPR